MDRLTDSHWIDKPTVSREINNTPTSPFMLLIFPSSFARLIFQPPYFLPPQRKENYMRRGILCFLSGGRMETSSVTGILVNETIKFQVQLG